MPEREVIVKCFNKPGATLLTTCSAISFGGDVVLMHGLPLAAIMETNLKKSFESIFDGVHSEIRPNPVIDEKIEFTIHEKQSFLENGISRPGLKMICAGMWTCPLVKSVFNTDTQTQNVEVKTVSSNDSRFTLHKQMLSLFILLETPRTRTTLNGHHIQIFNIADKLRRPSRGQNVIVEFTPFMDPLLMNSLTRGIVSKVFGRNDCMFITDAVTTPCSAGAPIFLSHYESSENGNGKGPLLGITCNLFGINEITVAISLLPVLWRLLPPGMKLKNNTRLAPPPSVRTLVDETVVSISCVNTRSTGFVIDAPSGTILTCSHGIPKDTTYIHVFHKGNIYSASLVYKTEVAFPCDLAVIKISPSPFTKHIKLSDRSALIGERVHAAGFPHFPFMENASFKPFIFIGHVVRCNPSSFIVTTCFTFPGLSGGAIIKNGKLLGMIQSNFCESDKSSSKTKNHFRLSIAVPTTAFFHNMKQFIRTKNIEHLKNFESSAKKYSHGWLVPESKM